MCVFFDCFGVLMCFCFLWIYCGIMLSVESLVRYCFSLLCRSGTLFLPCEVRNVSVECEGGRRGVWCSIMFWFLL